MAIHFIAICYYYYSYFTVFVIIKWLDIDSEQERDEFQNQIFHVIMYNGEIKFECQWLVFPKILHE